MNTFAKTIVALPLIASSLTGCAVLEATGEIAMGTLALVGETTLFVADTATFGAISSLTGLGEESWATTPSAAASTYAAAAQGYSAASGGSSSSAMAVAGLTALSSSGSSSSSNAFSLPSTSSASGFSSSSSSRDYSSGSSTSTSSSVGSANNYDCESREKELMNKMQRAMGTESNSICGTARSSAPLFAEMAQFYRNCRALDPTGELARNAEENERAMRETARQVCTN